MDSTSRLQEFAQACHSGDEDAVRRLLETEIARDDWYEVKKDRTMFRAAVATPAISCALCDKFGWKFMFAFLQTIVEWRDIDSLALVLQNSKEYFFRDDNDEAPPFDKVCSSNSLYSRKSVHPIFHAIRHDADLPIIQCLVLYGKCIPLELTEFEEALQLARARASEHHDLLDYLQAIVNVMEAICTQNHAEITRCLQAGAPANLPLKSEKFHPGYLVHCAIETGDVEATRLLLDYGAKMHRLDLHVALEVNQNDEEYVRWLCRQPCCGHQRRLDQWQNAA